MSQPLVSIGLPVHNGEDYLCQALDSLLDQQFDDFELIISDNASTDRTAEICERYARQDERIRYIRQDSNYGALYNFNRVLTLARGTYFMWAAYDDLWDRQFLATLVPLLEVCPHAILAFGSCDRIDTTGKVKRIHREYGRLSHPVRLVRALRYIWFPENEGRVMVIFGLWRTALLREIEVVHYDPPESSDDMLVLKALLKGNLVFSPLLLFHKRDVPTSSSFNRWGMSEKFAYYRSYRRVVAESNISLPEKFALIVSIYLRQVVYQFGKPVYRLLRQLRT